MIGEGHDLGHRVVGPVERARRPADLVLDDRPFAGRLFPVAVHAARAHQNDASQTANSRNLDEVQRSGHVDVKRRTRVLLDKQTGQCDRVQDASNASAQDHVHQARKIAHVENCSTTLHFVLRNLLRIRLHESTRLYSISLGKRHLHR